MSSPRRLLRLAVTLATGCNVEDSAYTYAGSWTEETVLTLTTGGNVGVQKQQGATRLEADGDSVLTSAIWASDCPLAFVQEAAGAATFNLRPVTCPPGAGGMSAEFNAGKLAFSSLYAGALEATGTFSATDGRSGIVSTTLNATR